MQGVRLKLQDLFEAQTVSREMLYELPDNFYAMDWTQTHGNLFSAIQMEKAMMGLLLMLIVAVAAFNIVSSLVMVVTDKKADIAILRTLGASPQTITRILWCRARGGAGRYGVGRIARRGVVAVHHRRHELV